MRIAVDVDGVFLDLVKYYCVKFNSTYDTNYCKSDVKRWDFYRDWGISKEEAYEIFNQLHEKPNNIPLQDTQAPYFLKTLIKSQNVDILTARKKTTKIPLINRLKSLGINMKTHYEKIVLTSLTPSDIKADYDYEIFIDDNPNLANNFSNLKHKVLLLFNQNWNKHIICKNNIYRVKSWENIYDQITKLDKTKI